MVISCHFLDSVDGDPMSLDSVDGDPVSLSGYCRTVISCHFLESV